MKVGDYVAKIDGFTSPVAYLSVQLQGLLLQDQSTVKFPLILKQPGHVTKVDRFTAGPAAIGQLGAGGRT